jgi:excisionase family DNA binding protein
VTHKALSPRLVTFFRVKAKRLPRLAPMTSQHIPRLLGRAEVAAQLGISRQTLDRLVKAGALPVVRLDRRRRFLPEDVEAFVQSRRTSP